MRRRQALAAALGAALALSVASPASAAPWSLLQPGTHEFSVDPDGAGPEGARLYRVQVDDLGPVVGPTPTPTPTPVPSQPPSGALSWAPPALQDPITVDLAKDRSPDLRDGQDYIITDSRGVTTGGTVTISGGDDVVWIGGEVDAPGSKRAVYLKGVSGVLHVEGLHIRGANLQEGINIGGTDATTVIRLQNVLVDQVNGSREGHHADIVQTWDDADLQIDRLEGTTTYQGFMWDPTDFGELPDGGYDVRNTVLRKPSGGGYPIYKSAGQWPISTSNVLIVRPNGEGSAFYDRRTPEQEGDDWAGVKVVAEAASPLSGDPGVGYRSPGYLG